MNEYLIYEGTMENICKEMAEDFTDDEELSLTKEDCKHIINFIQENKEFLDDNELIQCTMPERNAIGISEFITEQMSYYIAIKQSSIYLILFLLDFPTKGVASFIAKLLGFQTSGKVVVPIDTENGLKCIVMELARNRKRGVDANMMKIFKGECCNNHYPCGYRQNGFCNMKSDEIEKILKNLEENNVVKKKGTRYYYQL